MCVCMCVFMCARVCAHRRGVREEEVQSAGNYLCIKNGKSRFSGAVEAHLPNNADSSSFSTTIEGT